MSSKTKLPLAVARRGLAQRWLIQWLLGLYLIPPCIATPNCREWQRTHRVGQDSLAIHDTPEKVSILEGILKRQPASPIQWRNLSGLVGWGCPFGEYVG